jgi:F420-dependent oxidoreductase-like protein
VLEAYTTLGYLAAATNHVLLHTLVTAVTYRRPGLLAKTVSTLDTLSGGRAGLGIGVGVYEQEAAGLGLDFAPVAERFERLEETLQICLQMWSGDQHPYTGRHYQLARTLDSPTPISKPHPYLLIAGGGRRKTLRLVARYANACNIFGAGADARRTLDALREHCQTIGRDYDEIDKTTMIRIDNATSANELVERLHALHEVGITTTYIWAHNPEPLTAIDTIAQVVPQTQTW